MTVIKKISVINENKSCKYSILIGNNFIDTLEKYYTKTLKGKKIYGKTGTSDGNKDLWFIGSLDNLTTGIWMGYDDNKESELSSGNSAYLWKKFISEIYKIQIKK